ncbi:MAG: 5'-deoxynucleotidase [Methylococcales bacterium]
MKMSTYFAYLTRLRWIKRWGLMRNAYSENVMEHSWEVSVIAHTLALIKNQYFKGHIDANAVAVAALYHDVTEVITGDMPTPIKYHSPDILQSYKAIEKLAGLKLTALLPTELTTQLQPLLCHESISIEVQELVGIADKISAYLKCFAEADAGSKEFQTAADELLAKISASELPEVDYFMKVFIPACGLTLDNLMKVRG